MGGMPRRVGLKPGAVDEVNVAQQEHALPRHQHIVEKDHAVHLLEARGERMVEVRTLEVETLAAQEAKTRRAAWDRKSHSVGIVTFSHLPETRRVDCDF